jgi:hypothetical protein
MTEENENVRMSKAEHPVDETQELSEDAGGLGPIEVGAFTIGRVDEIVGEGGLEIPGYKATKYEAIQIVKLWAAEMIDLDFDYFLYGSTGSTEWRTREYANRRLNTIAKSIGEEEVKRAFKQAEQEFAKGVDQRAWKIFREGTKEEQESFQEEVQKKLAGDNDKHKPSEPTKDPYSQQILQRAYQMCEEGSTRFAIMNETGVDRETADWIHDRQSARLGLPAAKPATIVETEREDEL